MNDLTLINPPPGIAAADYAAIEDAVMETARGRWFLLEYARRQRAAETQRLADAVDRLEHAIETMQPQFAAAAAAQAPELLAAPTNETAAAVAEKLSDIVWTMRERGVGDQFCAELEKQIRIIRTLRVEIEAGRDEPALPTPGTPQAILVAPAEPDASRAPDSEPPPQPAFEALRVNAPTPAAFEPVRIEASPPPRPLELPPPWRPLEARVESTPPPQKPAVDPRIAALARLDALPLSEKIALFC